MAIRKRGRRWHFDLQVRGTRHRGSIPEARTKQEALDAEAAVRRSIYEGRWGKEAGAAKFSDFVDSHFIPYCRQNRKRHSQDEHYAEVFKEHFAGKRFADITPMMVERLKKELREGRKGSTVNQYLAVLNRVFSLAIENGYANSNPLQKVRRLRVEHRDRYMTREEEAHLRPIIEKKYPLLLPLLDLALNTGMRHREMTGLLKSDIDLDRRAAVLPAERTKEKRRKVIPLNAEACRVLSALIASADGERLFGRGYDASWTDKQWKAACREAGVRDLRVHDLRHTFATRLAEAGVPETAIMGLLGHSSLRMTTHYAHPTEEGKRAGVEALAEKPRRENVTEIRKTGSF